MPEQENTDLDRRIQAYLDILWRNVYSRIGEFVNQQIVAQLGNIINGGGVVGGYVVGVIPLSSLPHHAPTHRSGGVDALSPYGGEFSVVDLLVTGLTGAVAASRYAGATVSGAPVSGSFSKGDFIVDQTGFIWICITAGSPGSWQQAGTPNPMSALGDMIYGGVSPAGVETRLPGNTTATREFLRETGTGSSATAPVWETVSPYGDEFEATDFKPDGLTGATAASRYVGATASGSPISGTFAKGDFIIDQTGVLWICTTAGSPGTWQEVGLNASYVNWTAFVTQSSPVGVSITEAKYIVIGAFCHIYASMTVTGSGVGSNPISIGGMPTAARPLFSSDHVVAGNGSILNNGVATYYFDVLPHSSSELDLVDQATRGYEGVNPNFALANGDVIAFSAIYRVLPGVSGSGGGGGGGSPLEVKEADGTPDVLGVTTIIVSEGTLTDNGGGTVTLASGGASKGSLVYLRQQFV